MSDIDVQRELAALTEEALRASAETTERSMTDIWHPTRPRCCPLV
jgi:hypothetical protein